MSRPFLVFILAQLITAAIAASSASAAPLRIISLGPAHTENIFLLGAGNRLVACTLYCTRPEAAMQKEKIGTVMDIDVEKILALRPDLVVATGLTQPRQLEQLRRLAIPVVQFREPKNFAEMCEQFLQLGRILALEEQARTIVLQAREQVDAIRLRVSVLPARTVLLQIGSQPLYASTANSFTHDLIQFGGGRNIAASQPRGNFSDEKVLALNPDVILIAIMGSETGVAGRERTRWQTRTDLKAVQRQEVYIVDPDLICSPTPVSFVEALTLVAGLIHPEVRLARYH